MKRNRSNMRITVVNIIAISVMDVAKIILHANLDFFLLKFVPHFLIKSSNGAIRKIPKESFMFRTYRVQNIEISEI